MRASPCHQEGLYLHKCAQIDFPKSRSSSGGNKHYAIRNGICTNPHMSLAWEVLRGGPAPGLTLRTSTVSWPLASRHKQARTGWPSWDRMEPGLAGVCRPHARPPDGCVFMLGGVVTRTLSSLAGLLLIPCSLLRLRGFCYTDCVLPFSMPHF